MKKALTIALAAALGAGGMMAQAYEQGDWVLRVGATTVDPDTDSDDINLPDGMTVAQADVDDDTQLGIIPAWNCGPRRPSSTTLPPTCAVLPLAWMPVQPSTCPPP